MNTDTKTLQRQYLEQVSRAMTDMPQMRERLLNSIETSIEDYLLENPNATMQDLYKEYGDPKQIAENALQETGFKETFLRLRQNQRIKRVLMAVIVVLMAVVVFFEATKGVMVITTEKVYTSYPEDMTAEEISEIAEENLKKELQQRIREGK